MTALQNTPLGIRVVANHQMDIFAVRVGAKLTILITAQLRTKSRKWVIGGEGERLRKRFHVSRTPSRPLMIDRTLMFFFFFHPADECWFCLSNPNLVYGPSIYLRLKPQFFFQQAPSRLHRRRMLPHTAERSNNSYTVGSRSRRCPRGWSRPYRPHYASSYIVLHSFGSHRSHY